MGMTKRKFKGLGVCKKCGGTDYLFDDGLCFECHRLRLKVESQHRGKGKKNE